MLVCLNSCSAYESRDPDIEEKHCKLFKCLVIPFPKKVNQNIPLGYLHRYFARLSSYTTECLIKYKKRPSFKRPFYISCYTVYAYDKKQVYTVCVHVHVCLYVSVCVYERERRRERERGREDKFLS